MDRFPHEPSTQGFNVTTTDSTAATFLDTGLPLFSEDHFKVACTSAEPSDSDEKRSTSPSTKCQD